MTTLDTQLLLASFPTDWYWHVGGDMSRAWSSAVGGYVNDLPPGRRATMIGTEAELSDVLRQYGLPFPVASADDVRAEAQRRIIALTGAADLNSCMAKQLNALMRVGELNDKQARGGDPLTSAEQAEAQALRGLAAAVKAIRAASNVMEPNPPANYADDVHWP